MKRIISPTVKNLYRVEKMLTRISSEQFSDTSIKPYNSSIGGHLRHILDIFACIANGLESKKVDLTLRGRDITTEMDCGKAHEYLLSIIQALQSIEALDPATPITLIDDLGEGKVEVPSTLGGGLCQAHSHAIHHFACIGYMLNLLGEEIPDARFGYNPTTP